MKLTDNFTTAITLLALGTLSCGGGSADKAPTGQARFLIGTRVFDASGSEATSYFHLLPSLDQGTPVDQSRALEVGGSAKLYALPGLGWFAVGGGEEPTITRYTVDASGAFTPGTRISLQPYGVTSLWDTLYFVSPTKAYYPDRAGNQLIIWNPTDMTVQGALQLPQTVREGHLALYGYAALTRGTHLLFSVGWFDWETNDTVLAETGLVDIDTATDTVARFDVDTRCGGITQPVATPDGDTYFVSSALAGAANRLGRLSTKPCALRVRAGASAFDATFAQQLGDLTGGKLAGEPVAGAGGSLFLRVFDESLAKVEDGAKTWDLTGQAAWRWLRWTPGTGAVAPVDALSPSTADVLWFQVDGHVYGTETKPDYSETTLIDLTADGGPKRTLTVPGFLHGVASLAP